MQAKVIFVRGINCGPCQAFLPFWNSFIKEYKPKNISFEIIEVNMETKEYDKSKFPIGLERYCNEYPSIFFWKVKDFKANLPTPFKLNRMLIINKDFKAFEADINKFLKMEHKEYETPHMSFQQPQLQQSQKLEDQTCKKLITLIGMRNK